MMPATDPREPLLLHMRGICKIFPGVVALDEVDFELRRGEVHVLAGENGAGKSTLMKILGGVFGRDRGQILIDGRPVEIASPRSSKALGVSVIYQEFNLIPHLSAAENIFLGKEPGRWPGLLDRHRMIQDAQQLLASLGVRFDPRTVVCDLGIAERQMVEIAKSLSDRARILVMDEPTSALTESEIERLFDTIRRLTALGTGVVYISHRMLELSRIGDRVTVLRDGRRVATRDLARVSVAELVRLMVDREVAEQFPARTRRRGAEVLRVEGLRCGTRLRDVSFVLHEGEILGVAGLLGAGRTELARAIMGADPASGGRLFVRGHQVRPRSPGDMVRRGVGFLPEDRKAQGLVLSESVQRNVGLPILKRLSRLGVVREAAERRLAQRWVDDLRIKTPGLTARVASLSGGTQQKVVLGKWLAAEANILIVDEPTRGIDVASKAEIYQLLDRLASRGAGILMISSELPEILGLSDRILVMHRGRIHRQLDGRHATQEQVLHAALGLAS
jgi:ribose transport system ATP-binding protein